jgi:multicomponent Na+:H+ antiporter subunit E
MAFLVTFLILTIFWVFMSGLFDTWHFGLGILSCALVAYMSSNLLFTRKITNENRKELVRLVKYLPWLLYQIYLSNIYVVKLALNPKMKNVIYPHVVKFRTTLKKDLSLFVFANSITLTPGTITVLIENDCFYVHAIDTIVADSLPGEMEERVGKIFGEYGNSG